MCHCMVRSVSRTCIFALNSASSAVVALRVSAIHNDCLRIKRMLWIGGIFYALSTTGLITGASLAILRKFNTLLLISSP